MKDDSFTFIDLFSGIGGFHRALSSLGGRCLGFSEIDRDAVSAYCANTTESMEANFGDITQIGELPKHDLLTAGVPCQSWSIAGKNLGFDDDRGQLWNDTIYLLNQSRPGAFIFENVKGLVDPRNKPALDYIMQRIRGAGYHADYHVINSYDYGVMQNRVRIYIIGFREREHFENFSLPPKQETHMRLGDLLDIKITKRKTSNEEPDLFGNIRTTRQMSLSASGGMNDYFLYNDIRNGDTTIHSWDLKPTTERQKSICLLLLRNRRKKAYGCLDGNPLSLAHFQFLDPTITQKEIDGLVELKILAPEDYAFRVESQTQDLSDDETELLSRQTNRRIIVDELKADRDLKLKRTRIKETLMALVEKNALSCTETRYDFKNTKISTGLDGVNRVFLPGSSVFPTLVASDTNDMVATRDISAVDSKDYRRHFIEEIHQEKNFRKITRSEACLLQGFPADYKLPESRARWMKLIGNSVSVPVIETLCKSILVAGAQRETALR
ncbi:MAG: DNA (cytosine-5-)-methyltransferase [Luteolibacter sp.]